MLAFVILLSQTVATGLSYVADLWCPQSLSLPSIKWLLSFLYDDPFSIHTSRLLEVRPSFHRLRCWMSSLPCVLLVSSKEQTTKFIRVNS